MSAPLPDAALSQRLAELEKKLRAPALYERKAALDELSTIPSELAVPILQRLLAENEVIVRRLAVMGLGNHRTEESFQTLQRILQQDKDGNVLGEAANSIFEFGDRAIPLLKEAFDRVDQWLVRQSILSLLVETTHYDVLLELALKAIAEDQEQSVREVGILALNRVLNSPLKAQALGVLAEQANSPDWRTRWRTAIALHGCPDPQAKQLIAKLQHDVHYRVVAAALEVSSQ